MSWYLNLRSQESWAYALNAFTPEECDLIIKTGTETELTEGLLQGAVKNSSIRKSKISFFDSRDTKTEWIYRRATDILNSINKQFWNYDLDYIENLQFTSYTSKDDFYGKHWDMLSKDSPHYRKLSFSVQLSDPKNYEGSDLVIIGANDPVKTIKDRGAIIFFPSFVLHEVTPLVSGERYSLVGWVCGPSFR